MTKPSELLALCVVFTHRRFWVPSPVEHYRMSSSPVMSHLRQVDSEYFHLKVTKKVLFLQDVGLKPPLPPPKVIIFIENVSGVRMKFSCF